METVTDTEECYKFWFPSILFSQKHPCEITLHFISPKMQRFETYFFESSFGLELNLNPHFFLENCRLKNYNLVVHRRFTTLLLPRD